MGLWTGTIWAGHADVIESVENGEINWSRGTILAKGSGAPPNEAKNIAQARLMAERAALADARHNLMEVLKKVQVDSVSQVEDYLEKNDQLLRSSAAFIQGSKEVKDRRRNLPDGGMEVTLVMNLWGDFMLWMLSPAKEMPGSKPLVPGEAPSQVPPLSPGKEVEPPPEKPQVTVEEKLTPDAKTLPALADLPPFTGLVIDARGVDMRPALIPRILNASGQELYPGQYVPPEKGAQNGLALYARDLTAGQTTPRVGKKPLIVKAFRVNPERPSEILLTGEDSKRVAPFAQKGTFLEEGRVMIILD